ncbi:3244_t:CDS:2 [Entrophospora sp. SA101]|nr:3244_t:CDS:2 [Entrophospora sp. SA101]CAJ0837968.1 13256_t:CDS:2 [Entrophospora sp. SA101]
MTLPKSTQKITDKLNQKMNISNTSELWLGKRKLHASSFEFTENSDSNPTSIISKHASSHGLVSAIIHSYTLHQHLRLSPDDVWLTIAQCISRHIWNNAERFRYLFVSHEGHEDVFVDARDIIGYVNQNFIGDWSQAISRLSKTIDKRVKKVGLKQHLECDFSISTISWLEPVITQFVAIYKGDVDEIFWSMVIFNTPYSSGIPTPCWDGWIGALFPYGKSEGKIMNNTIIPDEVPSGLVHVPFNLGILAESFKLKFAAGFFGARQVKVNDEYVISPVIGWYILKI